jgi:hypothetical protein
LIAPSTCFCALVGAHRQHAFERAHHRRRVARGQQVGQVFDRDAQLLDVRDLAVGAHLAGVGRAVIGDSGGTYQTIGSVRYSGCSGSATFHSTAIL